MCNLISLSHIRPKKKKLPVDFTHLHTRLSKMAQTNAKVIINIRNEKKKHTKESKRNILLLCSGVFIHWDMFTHKLLMLRRHHCNVFVVCYRFEWQPLMQMLKNFCSSLTLAFPCDRIDEEKQTRNVAGWFGIQLFTTNDDLHGWPMANFHNMCSLIFVIKLIRPIEPFAIPLGLNWHVKNRNIYAKHRRQHFFGAYFATQIILHRGSAQFL